MLPSVAREDRNPDSHAPGSSPGRHQQLTGVQAWTLDHITHCPSCGTWEVVTDRELRSRQEPTFVEPSWCRHTLGDLQ